MIDLLGTSAFFLGLGCFMVAGVLAVKLYRRGAG